jgi:hypothetical protein
MKQPTLTTEQAAAAIVALINARPQSPSQAKIVDTVVRVDASTHHDTAGAEATDAMATTLVAAFCEGRGRPAPGLSDQRK